MPSKGKGRLVNRADMAEIFGVSLPTIDAWRRNGCPVVVAGGKGREWEFNTADVWRWKEQQSIAAANGGEGPAAAGEQARTRKAVADAGLAEIELRRRQAELVEAEDVETAWAEIMLAARSRFLSIPSKLAPVLVIEKDAAKAERILEDAIHDGLNELARGLGPEPENSSNRKPRVRKGKAAAKTQGK